MNGSKRFNWRAAWWATAPFACIAYALIAVLQADAGHLKIAGAMAALAVLAVLVFIWWALYEIAATPRKQLQPPQTPKPPPRHP